MRFRSTSQPSPEHWSKDFVEHLRTVHFALVAVSVGIILLLSSKTYDARVAAAQLADIAQIRANLVTQPEGIGGVQTVFYDVSSSASTGYSPWFSATADESTAASTQNAAASKLFFHIQEPYIFICHPGEATYLSGTVAPIPTMRAFEEVWEDLKSDVGIDSIVGLAREGALNDVQLRNGTLVTATKKLVITSLTGRLNNETDKPVELALDGNVCPPLEVNDSHISLVLTGQERLYQGHFLNYTFHVEAMNRYVISQRLLSKRFPDLKVGSFKDAAADLAEAVRGREEEDFPTLATQIYAESRKGDEAFDAFGIKFPSEQVTRWGIAVLIGVQLYFVMYLRRLSNKLKPDDRGTS